MSERKSRNAGEVWFDFCSALRAWRDIPDSERALSEGMRNALDAANDARELAGMEPDAKSLADVAKLAKSAKTAVDAARKRKKRSPKGDEGEYLLALVHKWLTQNAETRASARSLVDRLRVRASHCRSLRTFRKDGESRGPLAHVEEEQLAKAAKAVEKIMDNSEIANLKPIERAEKKNTDALDVLARKILQHVLQAFGLKPDHAKTYAGVRHAPVKRQRAKSRTSRR